ncbi:TetR family transcriptional regulator [Bosea sp. Root381]|jgi:AcrR family transcriptional regulator|uniref:TetR/AcrR family transcriptional regulator n=1 Tax=Bosea sp. Root381 TaxID=1736524 RepID=UPI0006FD640C|nr:TetR/AcrR family transcriptional regulator [Bosea sp. Root381]KRE04377.1 TetR family transcriptional regulator [Bosea sp. Root381]
MQPAPANTTRTTEDARQSRDEIIRAAAEVFMEFGYAASTIDAVAERLGATKGRIYHYYRSKAELYFDVQIAAMELLLAEIEPLARSDGTPAERLRRMALRHTEILMIDSATQKVAVQGLERNLLAAEAARHVKTLRQIVRMRDEYEQLFAEVIDAGIRSGAFVDLPPRLATKPLFGTLNWVTVWFTPRKLQRREDLTAIATTLTDYAMRGILKEPVS